MNFIANAASITTIIFGVVALVAVGLGVYWFFNKQARLRDIAELRKKLDKLEPSDAEYGAVRALYTSMVVDAHRWGFFHSDSESDGQSSSGDHGGGDHSSGGGHHH